MAKTTILLLLLLLSSILVVADQAATTATQLSPAAEKSIGDLNLEVEKVIDVVVSAAPPAKQMETMHAALKHLQPIKSALAKAKESGDEKKIAKLVFRVEIAVAIINAAPADKKLMMMEDSFNSVAAPSPLDCPTVDKAYCETDSKIQKAFDGVVAAAPVEKRLEVRATILKKTMYTAGSTINKAYADGDEKKIAQVLAAYSKAADEVIAAAPADKLTIMEKTFIAAAATGN
ncbi:hypothetical protein BDA96_06G108500 [Sorghum bicolor]|uniref:Uncharacterized protein n=1 Tax=Sorghum bicolor TaxID=4558 RepID=A0A921UBY2_SORBI|nr:hypothetical protein BDA96_06G108500 [Sorghum bicolor]